MKTLTVEELRRQYPAAYEGWIRDLGGSPDPDSDEGWVDEFELKDGQLTHLASSLIYCWNGERWLVLKSDW